MSGVPPGLRRSFRPKRGIRHFDRGAGGSHKRRRGFVAQPRVSLHRWSDPRFAGMLRGEAQVFTPYGATEALPVCSIGSAEILAETRYATDRGRGVCVGRPVPGIELAIIGVCDEPIAQWTDALKVADGEIGEIAVKGPQVTGSYFNRAESNALSKIADPEHNGFYHRMGDLGYRDVVEPHDALARTARWLVDHPPPPGGTEEVVLQDPFDYPAEDRLIAAWRRAIAAMPEIGFASEPGYTLSYSGPGGRARSSPDFE